jgi:membrane associated rhomboid family serine protease
MKLSAVVLITITCSLLFIADILTGTITSMLSLATGFDATLVYRLLTYGFVHGSFMHLAMNMLALFFIGRTLEIIYGKRNFLKVYLLAIYVSGLFTVLMRVLIPHTNAVVIGSSGAICSLLFVYWRMNPDARLLLFFVIPVHIKIAMIGFIAFDVICMVSPIFSTGLAHSTHLGGFLFGWLYTTYGDHISVWFARIPHAIEERRERRERSRREDRKRLFIEEVDPILKKISEQGIDSISDIEKAILRRAGKLK